MAVARVGATWPRPWPAAGPCWKEGGRPGVVDYSTYTNTAVVVLCRQRSYSCRGGQ
jgi:hypothetical protein